MSACLTAPMVRARKNADRPLVMVTAYDAPTARVADAAEVDLILVGDSVAMVVLGYDDTLHVTVDDLVHHTAAVARTKPHPMIVADLPWMSYHTGPADAVRNAARLVRAGAQAVKLEGGRKRVPVVEAIVDAEIPVMGHLGLTPQSFHAMGGFKVQGKDLDAAKGLVDDAQALAAAGCFAIVLEGIPDVVAQLITESVAGAHHRHRSRAALRRPGAGLPRRARFRRPEPAQVRPAVRHPEGRCRDRAPGVGGRRAQRRLSRGRRDLPHHPGSGRDAGRPPDLLFIRATHPTAHGMDALGVRREA